MLWGELLAERLPMELAIIFRGKGMYEGYVENRVCNSKLHECKKFSKYHKYTSEKKEIH